MLVQVQPTRPLTFFGRVCDFGRSFLTLVGDLYVMDSDPSGVLGERGMYEDKDLWPFKCPECGEEFTEEIGWLKAQTQNIAIKCPGILDPLGPILCPVTVRYSAEDFRLALAEAQAGRRDPFRETWIRKERP